jgi:transcriptional regulator with XRE-family HTH domain
VACMRDLSLKVLSTKMQEAMGVAGLTNAELARRTGFSRMHIGQIVAGKQAPSPDAIKKIASHIFRTPEDIQGWVDADVIDPRRLEQARVIQSTGKPPFLSSLSPNPEPRPASDPFALPEGLYASDFTQEQLASIAVSLLMGKPIFPLLAELGKLTPDQLDVVRTVADKLLSPRQPRSQDPPERAP